MKKPTPSVNRFCRRLRRLRLFLLAMLLAGVLGVAGLYVFLQTDRGGDWLGSVLSGHLGRSDLRLVVEGLRLRLPTHAHLASASLSGADGRPWLEVEEVDLDWNPWALAAQRTWSVVSLEAGSVRLLDRPSFGSKAFDQKAATGPLDLPRVNVQHLQIEALHIAEAVAGREIRCAVTARGHLAGVKAMLDLTLAGVLPEPLHAAGAYDLEQNEAEISAETARLVLGTNRLERIKVQGSVALNPIRGRAETTLRFNGLDTRAAANWFLDDTMVRFEDAKLLAVGSEVSGGGGYDWKNKRLDLDLRARFPDLEPWSKWIGWEGCLGALEGKVQVVPDGDRHGLSFQAQTTALETPYGKLKQGAWSGRIEHLFDPLSAAMDLEAKLEQASHPLGQLDHADLHLAARPEKEGTLPVLLQFESTGLTSSYGTAATVRVEATIQDLLTMQASALHLNVGGTTAEVYGVQARVVGLQLDLMPETSWSNLSVRADMALEDADVYGAHAESLQGTARWSDVRDPLKGSGTIRVAATNLLYGAVHLDRAGGTASGSLDELAVSLSAAGGKPLPLDLETSFQAALRGGADLNIQEFKGTLGGHHLSLAEPTRLEAGSGLVRLGNSRIRFDEAVLEASASLESNRVQAAVLLQELPIVDLPYLPTGVVKWVAGNLAGSAELSGTLAEPEIRAKVQGRALRPVLPNWPETTTFAAGAQASWTDTNLQVGMSFESEDFTSGEILVQREAGLSLAPYQLTWPTQGHAQASVKARVDLGLLNRLPQFAQGRIDGQLETDVNISGPPGNRRVEGSARLSDGLYDYYPAGLIIRDLNLELEGREGRLDLVRAEATDGGQGRISAQGRITPGTDGGYAYQVDVNLNRATLIRMDLLEAVVSGDLQASGRPAAHHFEGALKLSEGRLFLDALPPPSPPRIVPIPDPAAEESVAARESGGGTLPEGKVTLDIPGTLVARGEGLDSTWTGNGSLEAGPKGLTVSGELQPRRGTFQFLSRRFTLSEGRIWFAGGWPPMPYIDLTATVNRQAITAWLRVQGRADELSLSLEANPPMPEDEILAQILFGHDIASISGLQALQLAAAARTLAKGSSGPGMLDRARDRLGVDVVEIQEGGEGEESEPSLVVGKQLSERVYLQVDRSMNRQDSSVTAEFEVSPHFNIGVKVGSALNQGIGFNWKRNY